MVVLIKPQFEVGKGEVDKGGIVRDPEKHMRVIEKTHQWAEEIGLRVKGVMESPMRGVKGNREFFIHFVKADQTVPVANRQEGVSCRGPSDNAATG